MQRWVCGAVILPFLLTSTLGAQRPAPRSGAAPTAPGTAGSATPARLPDARGCALATDALGPVSAASTGTSIRVQTAYGRHLYSAGSGRVGTPGIRAAVQWPRTGEVELDAIDVQLQWYVPTTVLGGDFTPSDTVYLEIEGSRAVPIGIPTVPAMRGGAVPSHIPLMTRMPYGEGWRLAQAPRAGLRFKAYRFSLPPADLATMDALIRMAICRSTVKPRGG